jgi:hypothetical protein
VAAEEGVNGGADAWTALLALFLGCFHQPTAMLFARLAVGWVLCPGRHTLTRVYPLAEPQSQKAHDAYHRFFRAGAWCMAQLWERLAHRLVARFHPQGVIPLTLDDTTFHKTGRKMEGAGWWRDAVRSTGQKVVHCFGLNLVVLCVRIDPPWGGEPLSLPINVRLHHKGKETLLDQGEAMMREVAGWFPGRRLHLSADGFYATLAGRDLPNAHLTSRMRSDAAIYAAPPTRRPHQKGRSRKKGRRLPTPKELAQRQHGWKRATVVMRGKSQVRLLLTLDVLWYAVSPKALVRLVISRHPEGHEEDDFLFTTDLNATPESVVSDYAGRWSIEDTFRNVKQYLGGEDPQCWKGPGPERAAAFSFWIYSAVWLWHLETQKARRSWIPLPWYPQKATPSFADALACLRRALWRERLFVNSEKNPLPSKITTTLINVLAMAA